MFRSLRTRLIAAFALVIFLSLTLAGSAFVLLLREYQTEREMDRLQDLALPIAYQVRALEVQGASATEIAAFLERQAEELGVRIAVIDPDGRVVQDSDGYEMGAQVALPDASARGHRVFVGTYSGQHGELLFFAAPLRFPTSPIADRLERVLDSPSERGYVALLAPSATLRSAWQELSPRLAGAALASLLVSVAVALVLSASISRPLSRITRASEEMAHGNYDQEIPSRGHDEIARLASAFNAMARQVSQSHRAMRDLLANVSHDLRTPLTSIQGFSQAMLDGTLNEPAGREEAAQIIHQEAARMERLVEDLLYLSKIQSGQLVLERDRVALSEVVQACAVRARRRAEQAGLELAAELSAQVLVDGDGARLEQVLDNLLDNALRHTPPGGRVTLRLEVDRPGRRAVLRVHNSGSYIPTEDLPRVFERFYQADSARAKPSGGSGLGLAIAREILQAHGGSISAESSPDDGTTFSMSLPLLQPEAPHEVPTTVRQQESGAESSGS